LRVDGLGIGLMVKGLRLKKSVEVRGIRDRV